MNKIAISLLALTALTGAAFANDRTEEGTIASRNAGSAYTQSASQTAGASVVNVPNADASDFIEMKRYGIEVNTGNGND